MSINTIYTDLPQFTPHWDRLQCEAAKYLKHRAAFFIEGDFDGSCDSPFPLDAPSQIDLVGYFPIADITIEKLKIKFIIVSPENSFNFSNIFNRFTSPQIVIIDLLTNIVVGTGRFESIIHKGASRYYVTINIEAININYTEFLATVTGQTFGDCYAPSSV